MTLLVDLMPQLKESDMAIMRPIKFILGDGLTLHRYVSLPNTIQSGKRVPMIVIPHGGPHYIRDVWRYSSE
ncbi:hypothetical protein CMU01_00600 [Elizabethkingia anophelis]|nr:hypothetical protein [Elizabethkingia anophelis]